MQIKDGQKKDILTKYDIMNFQTYINYYKSKYKEKIQ